MTQAERDRLVTLKKAKKKVITQREAAEELGLSMRQVKRLLYGLKKRGDKAVVHGLRGKPSNRRMEEASGEGSGEDRYRRRCTKGSGRRWRRNTWRRSMGTKEDSNTAILGRSTTIYDGTITVSPVGRASIISRPTCKC